MGRRNSWQNLDLLYDFDKDGELDIPKLNPIFEIPEIDKWTRFNYSMSTVKDNRKSVGINFYVDDYQFERVWTNATKYVEYLKEFGCVIQPDFSMFTDFPRVVSMYNHYRNHWLGVYWQSKGINVIPSPGWLDKDSYSWCFDGMPEDSIIAVSNVGAIGYKENKKIWLAGYKEMLSRLQPRQVLLFSKNDHIDDYPGPIKHIPYERWQNGTQP